MIPHEYLSDFAVGAGKHRREDPNVLCKLYNVMIQIPFFGVGGLHGYKSFAFNDGFKQNFLYTIHEWVSRPTLRQSINCHKIYYEPNPKSQCRTY
jgi:hypothetical protein